MPLLREPNDAEMLRAATYLSQADRIDTLSRLHTATPTQIDNFVDTALNGTTIVQVRDQSRALFKRILKVIALDARR